MNATRADVQSLPVVFTVPGSVAGLAFALSINVSPQKAVVYIVYRHFDISFSEGRGSLAQKQLFMTYVCPDRQVLDQAAAVG